MSQTISKHIGEGFGKGELYSALAYDASDKFDGMKIKALMLNSTGRISFLDANAYIYSSTSTQLDIVATTIALAGALTLDSAFSIDMTLVAATYPIYSKADIQANAAAGVFINNYVLTEISTGVDLSGTAQVLGIDSCLSIEGADSGVTTLSSTGAFAAVAGYYYTDNYDIDVTNGVHCCLMAAPYYGEDYTVSAAGDFAGLFLFQCGNASATVPADQNSAILVGKNTGADSWGSVINIGQAGIVDYMFNMFDDDVLCGYDGNSATAGNPDGFIKIIIGGQTSYIWTYTNKA